MPISFLGTHCLHGLYGGLKPMQVRFSRVQYYSYSHEPSHFKSGPYEPFPVSAIVYTKL